MRPNNKNQTDYSIVTEEEQKRLLRLGNLVLIDYVRSMVDLLRQNLEEKSTQVFDLAGKIEHLKATRMNAVQID